MPIPLAKHIIHFILISLFSYYFLIIFFLLFSSYYFSSYLLLLLGSYSIIPNLHNNDGLSVNSSSIILEIEKKLNVLRV